MDNIETKQLREFNLEVWYSYGHDEEDFYRETLLATSFEEAERIIRERDKYVIKVTQL